MDPQDDCDKILFLQELRDVRALCHGPWLVAGDFNLIYQAEDKNNANLNRAMMGRFRRLLDDCEIKEIPLLGRKFTWSNERDNPTLVPSAAQIGRSYFQIPCCKVLLQ